MFKGAVEIAKKVSPLLPLATLTVASVAGGLKGAVYTKRSENDDAANAALLSMMGR